MISDYPDSSQKLPNDNQRDILNLIRLNQPVRRSHLTNMTNLTQQSVHRIVNALEAKGLVTSSLGITTGPGKPSPEFSLVSNAAYGVGILVNTDSVVICVVDFYCNARITKQFNFDITDRKVTLDNIEMELKKLLNENNIDKKSVCGIGFTLPGFFVTKGKLFNAPEPLRDWSLVDLDSELIQRFSLPVFLENSANAGAVGETLGPLGVKYKDFIYLGFDYGFGGAIVIDGKLHSGKAGNAGELSSIFVGDEIDERPAMGLLLTHLKANDIFLSGVDELKRSFDPQWPGVEQWIDKTMPHLNRLIFALTGIIDPEAIIFGGQIAPNLADILINQVRFPSSFRYDTPPPFPDLVRSAALSDPAAIGVAQLPLKYLYFR